MNRFISLLITLLFISTNCHASEKVRLVFFYASYCKACHMMAPTVKEVAEELNIEIVANTLDRKDIKEFPGSLKTHDLIEHFDVADVPAIALVNDKKKIADLVMIGVHSKQQLHKVIKEWMANTSSI